MSKIWKCCYVFDRETLGDHGATFGDQRAISDFKLFEQEWKSLGHILHTADWQDLSEFLKWMLKMENANVKVVNPSFVTRWCVDKRYLLQVKSQGISIPDTALYPKRNNDFPDLADILEEKQWKECIIKPVVGHDSLGVKRIIRGQNQTDAQKHLEDLLRRGDTFVQEYIVAGEIGCIFINHKFSHAIQKIPKEPYDISKGLNIKKIMPKEEVVSEALRVLDVAESLLQTDKHIFCARVDLFEDTSRKRMLLNEIEIIPYLFLDMEDLASYNLAQGAVDYLKSVY